MKTEIKQRIEKIKAGQVPEGYKKTKIGIVPKEWEIHKLSEHLTESRILGSNGAAAKKITVKLWNKGVFEKQELHEGSANTTYYKRKSGQFVYSKLDFLNCAFGIIPEHLDGYESTQDLPCFDVDGVDTYYLLTYVTQRNFYTHFGMIADGGRKARRVGTKDMMSFPLAYPPLAEQKKIAKILSAQDKLIELQQKKIEELQKLKKVYLNKMFPKKGENVPEWRFKGFTNAWEQRKFSELVQIERGGSPRPIDDFITDAPNGLNWIKIGDAPTQGNYITKTAEKIRPEGLSKTREVHPGDLILSNSMSFGKPYIMGIDGCIHDGWLLIRNTYGVFDLTFLCHLLGTPQMLSQYRSLAAGSTVNNLNKELVGNTVVTIPSITEQRVLGDYLEQLDNLITLHQRKLEEMKKQKKSLMQLLLTGIVRA